MEEMESQIREEIRKGTGWGLCRAVDLGFAIWGMGLRSTYSSPGANPPGFAELQTDMTDLTKELNRSQGIPFLEYKHFVTRTFFPKVSPHPCQPPQGLPDLILSHANLEENMVPHGPLEQCVTCMHTHSSLGHLPSPAKGGGPVSPFTFLLY